MAASLLGRVVLASSTKVQHALRPAVVCQNWTRTAFFRRKKNTADNGEDTLNSADDDQPAALVPASNLSKTLRKREGLVTVRAYKPPSDVESRVQNIVCDVCGDVSNWANMTFDDNRMKYKILDRAMRDFDHFIPNSYLASMNGVSDVLAFFSTPVHDKSALEDVSELNLPPNLHIQLEPLRFDPETDTMFGGKTAFPDRPTVISSLKYKRKYGQKQTK